jgi:hypothetical protein
MDDLDRFLEEEEEDALQDEQLTFLDEIEAAPDSSTLSPNSSDVFSSWSRPMPPSLKSGMDSIGEHLVASPCLCCVDRGTLHANR